MATWVERLKAARLPTATIWVSHLSGPEVAGLGASPGVVEGTARFVSSLEEFDQVRKGDILVCQVTNPTWSPIFQTGFRLDIGSCGTMPMTLPRRS